MPSFPMQNICILPNRFATGAIPELPLRPLSVHGPGLRAQGSVGLVKPIGDITGGRTLYSCWLAWRKGMTRSALDTEAVYIT